jgi:hypothetical protein
MNSPQLDIAPIGIEECWEHLRSTTLGRVGVTMGALPVILPVFYGVIGREVIFRTTWGTKLEAATIGMVVAFEADSYDPGTDEGWSVVIQGLASEITGIEEELLEAALPPISIAWPDQVVRYVTIGAASITGRRVQHREVH